MSNGEYMVGICVCFIPLLVPDTCGYCLRSDLYSLCMGPLRQVFMTAIMKTLCRRIGFDTALLSELRALAAEILSTFGQICTSSLHMEVLEGPTPSPPPYLSSSAVNTGPNITSPNNDLCFLFVVVERLLNDPESIVVEHLGDAVKNMLDPDKFGRVDRERFLTEFYDNYIQWMLVPFADETQGPDTDCTERMNAQIARTPADTNVAAHMPRISVQPISAIYTSRRYICDIFSQCVTGHSYHMRNFISRKNVMSRVLKLLQSNYKHLQICALKFLRAVLAVKDDFYYRLIVKFDVMKPIFDLLREICTKDTVVTSIIIEIVDYIRSERIHSLIAYIVGKHKNSFALCIGDGVDSASGHSLHGEVFEMLVVTYDQLEDAASRDALLVGTASQSNSGTSDTERSLGSSTGIGKKISQLCDRESEEAYFFGDSESDEEDCYGPPLPPSNVKEKHVATAARKNGYFAGLRSDVVGSPSLKDQSKLPAFTTTGKSSLALISELYDDMDDDNCVAPTETPQPYSLPLSPCEGALKWGNGAQDSNTVVKEVDGTPPLPPLRSKYSCDDDDFDDNVFARAMSTTKNKRIPDSYENGSESCLTGSDVASAEPAGVEFPPTASGSTVSFSTKKKQVHTLRIALRNELR